MQAALVRLPCCVELASSTTIPSKTSTHKAYMLNRNRSLTLRLTSLFSRLGSLIVRIQSVFSSSSLLSSDLFSINKRHCIQLHAVSTICTLTFHTNSFIFRFISHRSLISFWQKKKKNVMFLRTKIIWSDTDFACYHFTSIIWPTIKIMCYASKLLNKRWFRTVTRNKGTDLNAFN